MLDLLLRLLGLWALLFWLAIGFYFAFKFLRHFLTRR